MSNKEQSRKSLKQKLCIITLNLALVFSSFPTVFTSSIQASNHSNLANRSKEKAAKTVNPVMKVTFDDGSAKDSSGNENHGTVVGDVNYVEGVNGKAIQIKNPDTAYTSATAQQYVNFGKPTDLQFGTADFTILFWLKENGKKVSDGAVIANKDWGTGRNKGFAVADYDNKLTLNFTAEGESRADTSGVSTAADHLWHHIAAVFDRSGDMILYIDGVEAAKKSISSQAGKNVDMSDFVLGADGMKHYAIEDSYIDELEVYRNVLTKDEISAISEPYILNNKIQELKGKLQEYESMLVDMNVSQEKKTKFTATINYIKEELNGTIDLPTVEKLKQDLQLAYNDLCAPEKGVAEFVVLSDTHVASSASSSSALNLEDALQDVKTSFPDVNLVMNSGDFASDGGDSEVSRYFSILDKYDEDLTFMTALGNHDVRWSSGWDHVSGRYMEKNLKYMGDTDKVYYDHWIDGYHFIVLNTEWDLKDRAFISKEQLNWLDKKLAEGAEEGKPIFISLHQPLRDTFWNSNEWDVGMQDHALKEILRDYPQTVMFTGHIHNGLGKSEIIRTDYGTMVDVPGFLSNDYGEGRGQLGYHVSVQDNKVQLSMRDFKNDVWLPAYNYTIDLTADAPVSKVLDVNFDDEKATDTSGNGHHGTIVGDVEFSEGVSGKAIHIVNSEDSVKATQYVNFGTGDDLRFGTDDFSIMFWYKGTKELQTEGSIIGNKDWDNGANQGLAIGTFTEPRPGIGLNFTAEGSKRKDTERYKQAIDGKWHHVTSTFDRDGKMTLYIDGKAVESKDISADLGKTIDVNTLPLVLGADGKFQYPVHDSYIDELKIYHKALGAAEVETMVTPCQVEADETQAVVTWDALDSKLEPAYILMNGQRYDVTSGDTSKVISGLRKNTTYMINVVTREKSIVRNLKDAFSIEFTTKGITIDKVALNNKIKEMASLQKNDYTKASWDGIEKALASANAIVLDEQATQEAVDHAVEELEKAVKNLVLYPTATAKAILKNAIDKAIAAEASEAFKTLAPSVKAMIVVTRTTAQKVYENQEATNTQCMDAWLNLANALQFLDFKADKAALSAFITICDEINTDEYTGGVAEFKTALANAKAVFTNANALQESIDQALQLLVEAKNGLVKDESVDKALLEALLTNIKNKVGDGKKYQQNAAYEAFTKALAAAQAVAADTAATTADVEKAIHALTTTFENIRLIPSEAALEELKGFVNVVNKMNRRLFTTSELMQIDVTTERVNAMLQDFDEVAFMQLQKDMAAALKIIETVNSKAPAKSVAEGKPGTRNAATPNTNDATNIAMLWSLLLGAGIMLVASKRRKLKE